MSTRTASEPNMPWSLPKNTARSAGEFHGTAAPASSLARP
jgi:hypothetical protein